MTLDISCINGVNNQEDIDNDKYAGDVPGYLDSSDGVSSSDETDSVSSSSSSSGCDSSSGSSSTSSSGGPSSADQSNYLENDHLLSDEELMEWIEDSMWDFMQELMGKEDELMTDEDGDGYYELDEQVIEKYYRKLASFSAVRLIYAMVYDFMAQAKENQREFWNPKSEEEKEAESNAENKPLTLLESVSKSNEILLGILNTFTTQLITKIQEKNMEVFNKREKKERKEAEETWRKIVPFSSYSEEYLETMAKESKKFKAAMENTMDSLQQIMSALKMILGDFNPDLDKSLQNAVDQIDKIVPHVDPGSVSDSVPYWADVLGMFLCPVEWVVGRLIAGACGAGGGDYSADYVDVNALKEEFAKVRENLSGAMNSVRVLFMGFQYLQDMKGQTVEAFTGVKSIKCKAEIAAQTFEAEANHQMMLFDRLTETAITTVKLHNQTVQIQKQLQKAQKPLARLLNVVSGVLSIVGLVLALIGLIFSWTGVGFIILCAGIAITAGLTAYASSKYQNDCVDDAYNPSENEEQTDEEAIKDSYDKGIEGLEQAQEDMLADLTNSNLTTTTGDGYHSVEYGVVASAFRSLVGLQNLIRSLLEIKAQLQALKNSIVSTFSGLSGPGKSQLAKSMLETNLATGRSEFSRLVSNVKECAEAFNLEHAQDIAIHNAGITLAWSMGLAVAGAALGGIASGVGGVATAAISVGMAVGQAIGRVIGEVGASKGWWGKGGSYGVQFGGKVGKFAVKDPKAGKVGKTDAGKIDEMENEVYLEALEDGTCDAGDGYDAVNNAKFAKLQNKLLALANIRAVMTAATTTLAQLKSMTVAAFGGVTSEEVDILSASLRPDLEGSIKVLSYIRDLKQECVIVQNRARDAEIALQTAAIKGAVSIALSFLSFAGDAMMALTPSLMSLGATTVDIISGAVHANSGYGDLEQQVSYMDNQKKIEAKNENARLGEQSAEEEALEQIDAELAAMGFDSGMLESVGGGHVMANSGVLSESRHKAMSQVRVAEIIKEAKSALAKMKADIVASESGLRKPDSQAFDKVVDAYRVMMAEILNSKFSSLQAYAQRTNQMADAERSMSQAIASAVIQAAITAISAAISAKTDKANEIRKEGELNGAVSDENNQQLDELNESLRNLAITNFVAQAIEPFVQSVVGAIYDEAANARDTSGSEQKIETKQQALTQGSDAEGFEVMDEMEAESVVSAYEMGMIEMDMEAIEVQAQLNQEIADGAQSSVKSMPNAVKGLSDSLDTHEATNQFVEFNELRNEVMDQQLATLDEMYDQETTEAIAAFNTAQQHLQDAIAAYQANPTPQNSANLQAAYADFVSSLAVVDAQITQTMDKLQALSEKVDAMQDQRAQVLGEDSFNDPLHDLVVADDTLVANTEIELQLQALQDRLQALRSQTNVTPSDLSKLNEDMEAISEQIDNIFNMFDNSQALVDASMAAISNDVAKAINDQIDGIVSEKETTEGKPLDEMSAEDLQDLYEDLRASQFETASMMRNASQTLKTTIMKIMSGRQLTEAEQSRAIEELDKLSESPELTTEEKQLLAELRSHLNGTVIISNSQLNSALSVLNNIQGRAQQKMTAFNRTVGKIRDALRKVTGNPNAELELPTSSVLAPQASSAPSQVAPPPTPAVDNQAPVTVTISDPQPSPQTTALLARAEMIVNANPILDENNNLNINGEVLTQTDLEQEVIKLSQVDRSQLTPEQQEIISNAILILNSAQVIPTNVSAAAAAVITESSDTDNTEIEVAPVNSATEAEGADETSLSTPAEPTRPSATLLAYADKIAHDIPVTTLETEEELIQEFQQVLDDPQMQLTEQERSNFETALANLRNNATLSTSDAAATVGATNGAGAAAGVAATAEADDNNDEELFTNEHWITLARGLQQVCEGELNACEAQISFVNDAHIDSRDLVEANA